MLTSWSVIGRVRVSGLMKMWAGNWILVPRGMVIRAGCGAWSILLIMIMACKFVPHAIAFIIVGHTLSMADL
jgi:hypothetical protein